MAGSEKLLNIEPQQLSFHIELLKQASCTIRLSSNSRRRVAFKVMTTSPEKYFVRPNSGIISPGSTCDIEVTMRAPEEIPPNMECKDKFLIKSVLAGPNDTLERTRKLFNERGHAVGDYKLKVVYVYPSHQQSSNLDRLGQGYSLHRSIMQETSLSGTQQSSNLDRSGQGYSLDRSITQERSLSGTQFQVQGTIERLVDNVYVKGIASLFLSLILFYLIMRILPVLWSWTLVATLLVIKMAKRLVSDSVEDWVVRTLVYLCVHFITLIFQRKGNVSGHESGVSVAR